MNKVIGSTLILSAVGLVAIVGFLMMSQEKKNSEHFLETSIHHQQQITNIEKRVWKSEKIIKAYIMVKK